MDALSKVIDSTKKLVFFGGAGVSTAAGIPDFRSENGLFRKTFAGLTPEMILSVSFYTMHPDIFFEYYRQFLVHPEAKPGKAHQKLAALEKNGLLTGLVTQNIDGLHRKAGNRLVYELHGSIEDNACQDCGKSFPLSFMLNQKGVPRCPICGGVVRPQITLYGEAPDHYVMTGACREIARCDTLIVAGTSLLVEPARSCLSYFRGRNLVVINQEKTDIEEQASLVIHEDIETVMENVIVPPARPVPPPERYWL